MLRIRVILERIRIRGSVTLTNGSGSCYFSQLPSRMETKIYFFSLSFVTYYFLTMHLYKFSKIKVKKKSQNCRNHKALAYYFFLMIEGSGSVPRTNGSGSIQEAQKHTDPDPQHCFRGWRPWPRLSRAASQRRAR